jgi:hypothetical protein
MAFEGYPIQVVTRARELHAAGFDSPTEIARIIARESEQKVQPSRNSVRRWIDPDYAEAEREKKRKGKPQCAKRRKAWRMRLDRMRELREDVGLSFESIAALVSHDFPGVSISDQQAERILGGQLTERTTARLLWPQGASR